MSEEGVERRLTTILAAVVVGYSRLMAADETDTLARLKAHRKELIEPKSVQHHGHLVLGVRKTAYAECGRPSDPFRTFAPARVWQ